MEPFGIFQFLQNLLTKPEEMEQNPPQKTQETEAETSAVENEKSAPQPSSSQAAILGFLTAHEQRAKNTRK